MQSVSTTATGAIGRLSAREVEKLLSGDCAVQLIDVRTPLEFDSEHIKDALNIPLDSLSSRGGEIKKDSKTILICRSGARAGRAAGLLSSYGLDCSVLDGGMVGWRKAGLSVVEGKKRLSLERQVQLAIGLILLSTVSAGFLVNHAWFAVPAFIGAGLTFAGLTGNCGLAMLIAKAPWNKLDSQPECTTKSCS